MNEKTARLTRTVYGAVLSISTVFAGFCLASACLGIYRSGGDDPFTPQAVATAFSGISLWIWVWLALAVGGFLLNFFLPREKKRPGIKSLQMQLRLQYSKVNLSIANPALVKKLQWQKKQRLLHISITLTLLSIGSALFLSYAVAPTSFDTADITACVIRAVTALVLCLAIPFGYGIFTAYFCQFSMDKELSLVKLAPRLVGDAPAAQMGSRYTVNIARLCVLAVAVTALLYGFFTGGTADVLTKAVNICTECVGLG